MLVALNGIEFSINLRNIIQPIHFDFMLQNMCSHKPYLFTWNPLEWTVNTNTTICLDVFDKIFVLCRPVNMLNNDSMAFHNKYQNWKLTRFNECLCCTDSLMVKSSAESAIHWPTYNENQITVVRMEVNFHAMCLREICFVSECDVTERSLVSFYWFSASFDRIYFNDKCETNHCPIQFRVNERKAQVWIDSDCMSKCWQAFLRLNVWVEGGTWCGHKVYMHIR